MLLFAIARVTMKLSNSVQPSHKVSKQRKYSSIYPDMIQRLGDVEKVFELSEKSKKNSISRADLLYDAESNSEKKFMLDDEPAISEDEGSECDSKSNCDSNSIGVSYKIKINLILCLFQCRFFYILQNNELMNLDSPDVDGWQMDATSSCLNTCINDIANDDFVPILNIEEFAEEEEENEGAALILNETIAQSSNMLSVPGIRTSASDNSISNILDFLGTNNELKENSYLSIPRRRPSACQLKSSGSDVSISFFLDREQIGDTFDENTFANVNTNVIDERNRKKSNANVTFQLDE